MPRVCMDCGDYDTRTSTCRHGPQVPVGLTLEEVASKVVSFKINYGWAEVDKCGWCGKYRQKRATDDS